MGIVALLDARLSHRSDRAISNRLVGCSNLCYLVGLLCRPERRPVSFVYCCAGLCRSRDKHWMSALRGASILCGDLEEQTAELCIAIVCDRLCICCVNGCVWYVGRSRQALLCGNSYGP